MPLYDFQCGVCGRIESDKLYPSHAAMVNEPNRRCGLGDCEGFLFLRPPAPSFHVEGFSSKNGYSGGQEYEVKVPNEKNMRVVVKS